MNTFVAGIVLALAALCSAAHVEDDFESWARAHGRAYASEAERVFRLGVFESNLREIRDLNAKSTSERYAANAFADMTRAELERRYTTRQLHSSLQKLGLPSVTAKRSAVSTLPTAFNWVDKGAVTRVKNQGNCGSCWAFGAVGTMEGQWFLSKGELVEFSEQNLVDCDHECMIMPSTGLEECDGGCDGGNEPTAFQHVIKNKGIMLSRDYPYTGKDGKCKFDEDHAYGHFRNWTFVRVDKEDDLRQYVFENGPVSVGVHADEWFYYSGGVFNSTCKTMNDHAVLLTGWGVDAKGTPFWIIKNSWDKSWGLNGYIHLFRGSNKCGMLEMMSQIRV